MLKIFQLMTIALLGVFLFGVPGIVSASDLSPKATGEVVTGPVFVRLTTEGGEMLGVFYQNLAPHHVASFIHLSRSGFYEGTKFHRIVPGFVIQGGDPLSKDMDPRNDGTGGPQFSDVLEQEELDQINGILQGKGYGKLQGEARLLAEISKSAKHRRGSMSMARGRGLHSAGSQFFICVDKATSLDGQYTIFGYVFKGMEVADAIVGAAVNPAAGKEAPAHPVAILKAEIISGVDDLRPDEKMAWSEVPTELRNVK